MAPARPAISEERAARVARSHACPHCLEYSYKKVKVRPASAAHRKDLKIEWIVERVCGVCGLEQELGIDSHGELIYGS